MKRPVLHLSFHRRSPLAMLAAALALVSQLALGALLLPDDRPADPWAALAALTVPCQPPGLAARPLAPDRHRRAPPAALAPLSVVLALPAVLVASAVQPPRRAAPIMLRAAPRKPLRAPPARPTLAAYPRGPPALG